MLESHGTRRAWTMPWHGVHEGERKRAGALHSTCQSRIKQKNGEKKMNDFVCGGTRITNVSLSFGWPVYVTCSWKCWIATWVCVCVKNTCYRRPQSVQHALCALELTIPQNEGKKWEQTRGLESETSRHKIDVLNTYTHAMGAWFSSGMQKKSGITSMSRIPLLLRFKLYLCQINDRRPTRRKKKRMRKWKSVDLQRFNVLCSGLVRHSVVRFMMRTW